MVGLTCGSGASVPAKLQTYVLSLKRCSERRAHMAGVIARLGLSAEFINAVDGAELTPAQAALYDRRKALAVYGAEMSPAEIGCCLSHLEAYRRMLADGADLALVLEDDVDCDDDLPALLREISARPLGAWQVLRLQSTKGEVLAASRPDACGRPVDQVGGRTVSSIRTGVLGACGYLITRQGAQTMLAYAGRPFMPIDQMMDRYWENGIEPHVLRPFPVRQSPSIDSAIGDRKTGVAANPASKLIRRSRRAYDGLAKRSYKVRREGQRMVGHILARLRPGLGSGGFSTGARFPGRA